MALRNIRYLWFLLVFLLTLELCVRIEAAWQWGAPLWGPYSFETLVMKDALGVRNRPYGRFEKWSINSQGFQGPELAIPKAKGITRIGVAGASEIFGLYESPGCDVTSHLRKLLETSAPGRFEVVNLATPGMSIPRIIENYERGIRKFDFDAVLYYPSPAMYLDTEAPKFWKPAPGNTASISEPRPHGWNLRLTDRTWKMLRERLPPWIQVELKRLQIERKRRKYSEDWVWENNPPEERVTLFREHLTELINMLNREGIRVILATHANRFLGFPADPSDKYMVSWIRFYPRASGKSLLGMEQKANQVIRDLAGNRDVLVVDIEKKVGKGPDNFADFVHFTDSGAALAAEAMRDPILTVYQE